MSTKVSQIKTYKNGAWQDITKVHDGSGWKNFRGVYSGGVWYELSTCQLWNIVDECYVQDSDYSNIVQTDDVFDFKFKPDGTKMYQIEAENDKIIELNLTSSWDVSNFIVVDSINTAYTSSFGTSKGSIFFKPDGTKMFENTINSSFQFVIRELTLSTPWNLSTFTRTGNNFISDMNITNYAEIGNSGTKLYIIGTDDTGGNPPYEIYQYTLSTAWDVTTSTKDKEVELTEAFDYNLSLHFKPDGTKMYVGIGGGGKILQYTLSTAWDVGSLSYDGILDVPSNYYNTMYFNPDGTEFFVLPNFNTNINKMYKYSYSS